MQFTVEKGADGDGSPLASVDSLFGDEIDAQGGEL
jgi:hypothetical protein